jgi:CRP-like cAMP-binding protein
MDFHSTGMDLFIQKIQSSISITLKDIDQIAQAFDTIEIDKGDKVIKENTICDRYYFLEKGLLRFVFHGKALEETSWVIFEGVFFSEIISLKSKRATNMSLEAMEPSTVLSIDESKLNELCQEVKLFERYLRLAWEENLYNAIQMKLLQQFSTAKERYETLIKDRELMQRVPQKYLASILGITPYTLSRLRSSKNP